jgi:hypothetical protein
MSLRERTRPGLGTIEPCLPSAAKAPPSGPGWIHEIKHDGFRIMARRGGAGVRLFSRNGYDFTSRFPLLTAAVTAAEPHRGLESDISSRIETVSRAVALVVAVDRHDLGVRYARRRIDRIVLSS